MSQMPLIPEIENLLVSTDYELNLVIEHARSDKEKITEQYVEGVISALERREKLLESCLGKVVTQEKEYKLPQALVERILEEIFVLETSRPLRSKIEAAAAHQMSFFNLLKRISHTLNDERYKIKVDKTDSGPAA